MGDPVMGSGKRDRADDRRLVVVPFEDANPGRAPDRRAAAVGGDRQPRLDAPSVAEMGDGAGLAVLLAWMAQAQGRGRRLRYENLPDALRRIARISEVETFLCP